MKENYNTKDMKSSKTKNSKTKESYFFAGEGMYKPTQIEAENIQEATQIWNETKELI